MNPIEHPETIMLIHNEKVRREMGRGRIAGIDRHEHARPKDRIRAHRVRHAVSNALIALARWVEPAHPAETGFPAGARH